MAALRLQRRAARTLSFNAREYADGSVTGRFEYHQVVEGVSFDVNVDVTCLNVYDGNRAKLGGWSEVRERAVQLFGDVPHAQTEQHVLDAFERAPATVAATIEHVGRQVANGSVRSGWAVLRSRLEHVGDDVVASDEHELEHQVATAELWLRNAGVHFDRESEVDAALFGQNGRLRVWAEDEHLRERLLELWRAERPRGERVEREQAERLEPDRRRRERRDEANRRRERPDHERRRGVGTDPDRRAGKGGRSK